MWRQVKERESGEVKPPVVAKRVRASRGRSLQLSSFKELLTIHNSSVNTIQIDNTELRYLLSGASDGCIAVYDIQQATCYDNALQTSKHEALFSIDRKAPQGHKYAVSSVCWYPIDTGLFVTGAFDNFVKVWDTNTAQVELQFEMPGKVYGVGMSSIATSHMLIATGTEDSKVQLCDIGSGASTHTLTGHRDGVWAVHWSASSEWILITGGCDGAIRLWDIRRAGCFMLLDQQRTQISQHSVLRKSSSNDIKKTPALDSDEQLNSKQTESFKHRPEISVQDRAIAHYGAVTGLQMTSDGFYLLSAGTDSRVRLWDMASGCNTLVNYPMIQIRGKKAIEFTVSSDSSLLFVPTANAIRVCDLWTGVVHSTLKGHYDAVNCCTFHPQDQELYSGSNDRKILVWGPPVQDTGDAVGDKLLKDDGISTNEDAWSD